MKIQILIGLAMLAVTSAFADQQADYMKQIREGGLTADFSQAGQDDWTYHTLLHALAEADAMIYFQGHKGATLTDCMMVGQAHAFKHHLIGAAASAYTGFFSMALHTLTSTQ
jgi:hypothetical protein